MCEYNSYKNAEQLYEQEEYLKALRMFECLDDSAEDGYVQNYIGCCLLKLERYSEATQVFESLINKNPNWCRPIFNLGQVYIRQGQFDVALMQLKKAIEVNPNYADAYFYLGVCYEKMLDYNNAIAAYKKSISIEPNDFEPHMGLSICYNGIGDYQNALLESEKAFFLFDCNDTLYNYTYFLNKAKRFNIVYDLLQGHNVIKSNDLGLIKNLMFCLKKLNKNDLCLECAQKILVINSEDCFAKLIIEQLKN